MGLLSGALGGQLTSLIVTCYKHPFLKHTKVMNGVAFLQLKCSIRTILQMTPLCVPDKLIQKAALMLFCMTIPAPSWEIQPQQWINKGSLYEFELVFNILIVTLKFPQSSKCTWTFQTGTPYTSGRVNWIRW